MYSTPASFAGFVVDEFGASSTITSVDGTGFFERFVRAIRSITRCLIFFAFACCCECTNREYCDKTYADRKGRQRHLESVHMLVRRCLECDLPFASRSGLWQHICSIHFRFVCLRTVRLFDDTARRPEALTSCSRKVDGVTMRSLTCCSPNDKTFSTFELCTRNSSRNRSLKPAVFVLTKNQNNISLG
jgi:hypothetical protein